MSEIAVGKGIKTQGDLAEFILNRGTKTDLEGIGTGLAMAEAENKLQRSKRIQLELSEKALDGTCENKCNGVNCTQVVLDWNGISRHTTPLFITRKHKLVCIQAGAVDETETQMMQVCW